jgi:hypothetical protein
MLLEPFLHTMDEKSAGKLDIETKLWAELEAARLGGSPPTS